MKKTEREIGRRSGSVERVEIKIEIERKILMKVTVLIPAQARETVAIITSTNRRQEMVIATLTAIATAMVVAVVVIKSLQDRRL